MKEEMEGKNLAQEQKVEAFINELKSLIKQSQEEKNSTISSNGYEVSFDEETKTYNVKFAETEILLAKEDENGFEIYPEAIDKYNKLVEQAQKNGVATLDKPAGLVESEELEEFLEKQKQEKEEQGEKEEAKSDDEREEEEKDDEKPELDEGDKEEKDKDVEEIAKQYNVNANQVIHLAKNTKLTENDRFKDLANWTRGYDDVYILPGEDPYTWKTIGSKKGEKEEIKDNNEQIGGKNPDITIKRIDGDRITEVKPLSVRKIDDKSVLAIVKDSMGRPEALYCRQEGGKKKEFWGSVVPEASGKNVKQQDFKTREFMDYRNMSNNDLSDKADALSRQANLEERGLPSKEKGVQVSEIEGSQRQNRDLNIEEVAEELMKRDGIKDRLTVPPGYYEHKAEEVLKKMENSENLKFEDAVEQVEREGKGPREEGGRQPGDGRKREE